MVLVGIVGALGEGKTLTLAYMVWNNYYLKKREIWSNITIYGIPFYKVETIEHLKKMIPEKVSFKQKLNPKEKFFAGDELWKWLNSRTIGKGRKEKQEIINRILLASRKRHVTIAYTTQSFTDLIFYPQLSVDNSYCRVLVFNGPKPSFASMQRPFYFNTEPIFAIYDTYENPVEIDWGSEEEALRKKYIPVYKNPAWLHYLMKEKGLTKQQAIEYSKRIEESLKV